MIVAIEGPSAAGKTTWCRTHFPGGFVEEAVDDIAAPDLYADPNQVARFWVNFAVQNWQRALELESANGIAVCDGDPFHLCYSWAVWKSGALTNTLFEVESELYRSAFEQKHIGFADYVLWLGVPTEELRRRAKSDPTRRRKRHEMYLGLVPWMKAWYEAREQFLPGTVRSLLNTLSVRDLPGGFSPSRHDTQIFDQLLLELKDAKPAPNANGEEIIMG
jgi:hypothetical protein